MTPNPRFAENSDASGHMMPVKKGYHSRQNVAGRIKLKNSDMDNHERKKPFRNQMDLNLCRKQYDVSSEVTALGNQT